MSTTSIEWATHVWNPFTGCDRVSPGCANCYAAETAKGNQRKELGRARVAREQGKPLPVLRYQNDGDPKSSGPGFGFTVHWDKLGTPERFPAGARVFVNSMSDVFHEEAPGIAICGLWRAFAEQPHANFLVLTKRPERMKAWVAANNEVTVPTLENVWLGVSIENRRFVHRADLLRQTPAAVRFISAEPLLAPLVAAPCFDSDARCSVCRIRAAIAVFDDERVCAQCRDTNLRFRQLDLTGIDWLIVGAESGAKRRRFDPQWARDLRDACLAQCGDCAQPKLPPPVGCSRQTAFFYKQGSAFKPGQEREFDGRTWDEMPVAT